MGLNPTPAPPTLQLTVNEKSSLFAEAKEQNFLGGLCFHRWLSLSQSCGPSGPNIHEYFTALATAKSPVSPSENKPQSKSSLHWEENCFVYRSEGESCVRISDVLSERELAQLCSQVLLVRKSFKCSRYGSQVRMMRNMLVLCFVCLICVCFCQLTCLFKLLFVPCQIFHFYFHSFSS